jgi:hypothetical protein
MEDRVDGLPVGERVMHQPDVPVRCGRVELEVGDWRDVDPWRWWVGGGESRGGREKPEEMMASEMEGGEEGDGWRGWWWCR